MHVVNTDAKSHSAKPPVEVRSGGREGKETHVPGGMPQAAQALLPLCGLGLWVSGCGGDGYPEEDSHSPCNKVAATLLTNVRLRQD